MAIIDLLLGTRRLRRNIELQSVQLHRDLERFQLAKTQLQETFIARATSPLGLASAAALGFILGRSHNVRKHSIGALGNAAVGLLGGIVGAAFTTMRTLGMQFVLPAAASWLQSKLMR